MRMIGVVTTVALAALTAPACTDPAPAGDAAAGRDAGVSDRATDWDHRVGYDVQFPRRDAGPGCGDVPATGRCDDAGVLTWCDDNAARQVDCAALDFVCAEKPSLGGFWCLAGPGQSCRYWPCREPLFCGNSWTCTGWPDGGTGEDRPPEDGAAETG